MATIDYKLKYEQALEVAQRLYNNSVAITKKGLEDIFPELAESESEKIRKDLIIYLRSVLANKEYGDKFIEDWIAWLENQNKKTEPIEDFDTEFERQISHLVASAINREHEYNKGYIKWAAQSLIEYAKREIEKQGEQKPDSGGFWEGYNTAKEKFEQKSSWSEDDELHIRELESLVKQVWAIAEHENDKETIHKMSDLSFFLKTLKPQLKQEWCEEDERCLTNAIDACKQMSDEDYDYSQGYIDAIKWLKSLRPKNTWRPSGEQMKALSNINVTGCISYAGQGQELVNLYNDLKKLREK